MAGGNDRRRRARLVPDRHRSCDVQSGNGVVYIVCRRGAVLAKNIRQGTALAGTR